MLWLSQVRSKRMTPGGIAFAGGAAAIGKFLAVIGQDLLHPEGRFSDESLEKGGRISRRFLAEHRHIHPARGAIDADEQNSDGRSRRAVAAAT